MRLFYIFFIVIAMSCSHVAFAAPKDLVQTADNFLRDIDNVSAEFVQSSDRDVRSGRLYVHKPYNVRVEYLGSYKELIIVNDKLGMHYDAELKEKNYINVDDVYFTKLFSKKFSLKRDANILSAIASRGVITVDFTLKSNPDIGKVSMAFNTATRHPIAIKFGDADGEITMSFTNFVTGVDISQDFFDLDNIYIK